MSDRNFGYFVLVFLFLLLLVPVVSFSVRTLKPVHKTVIVFPSANTLNFLKKQDPVKIRGVQAGSIRKIYWLNGRTWVEIETANTPSLHQGYRIVAEAKGFMGDRYLEIDPGNEHLPLIRPGEELTGQFPAGPVDELAHADSLVGKLRKLVKAVDELRAGTPLNHPFAERFREKTEAIDTMSANLQLLLVKADTTLSRKVDSLARFLTGAEQHSAGMGPSIARAESTAESFETRAQGVARAADSMLLSLDGKLRWLRAPESDALNRTIDSVKAGIAALEQMTEKLRRSGIKAKL